MPRNPLYQSTIKVGRTLIFYRPETSNAMETERFVIGNKILVFLQAKRRQHLAMRRVAVLADARRRLRNAVVDGEMHKSCNTDAIPQLTAEIRHCDNIHMTSFVIKHARSLLQRLHEVAACKQRISEALASESKYEDIVEYFEVLNKVLGEAAALQLHDPVVVDAQRKQSEIKERVDCLLSLRSAVSIKDDEVLAKALEDVRVMNKRYGAFCAKEESAAAALHQALLRQLRLIDDCSVLIGTVQRDVKTASSSNAKEMTAELECIRRSNPQLEALLTQLDTSPPESAPARLMHSLAKLVFSMRKKFIAENWSAVVEDMKLISAECKRDVTDHLSKMSSKYTTRLAEWRSVTTAEVELFAHEIDVRYYLPKLTAVVKDEVSRDPIAAAESQYKRLFQALDEIRTASCGTNVKALLPIFDTLLDMRKSLVADEAEVMLAITEDPATTQTRLDARNELVAVFNTEECIDSFAAIDDGESREPVDARSRRRSMLTIDHASSAPPPPPAHAATPTRRHTLVDKSTSRKTTVSSASLTASPRAGGELRKVFKSADEPADSKLSLSPNRGSINGKQSAAAPPPPPKTASPVASAVDAAAPAAAAIAGSGGGGGATPPRPPPPPPPPPPAKGAPSASPAAGDGKAGVAPPPPPPRTPGPPPPPPGRPPLGAAEGSESKSNPPPPPPPRRQSHVTFEGDAQAAEIKSPVAPPPPPPPPAALKAASGSAPEDKGVAAAHPPPPPPPPQPVTSDRKAAEKAEVAATPQAVSPARVGGKREEKSADDQPSSLQLPPAQDERSAQPVSPQSGRYHMSPYPPLEPETVATRKTALELDAMIAKMKGEFMECAKAARDELMRLRSIALERYAQLLLAEAVQFGAIQGTVGKLSLEKGSIVGLSKTLAEVERILRDKVHCSSGSERFELTVVCKMQPYVEPFTRCIKDYGNVLLALRKYILESGYEAIVKLHSKGSIDIHVPQDIPKSRVQAMFFKLVRIEVLEVLFPRVLCELTRGAFL
jgi:hypothetical protein